MASDASAVLGSAEVAGTFLSPKGLTKKMATQSAGRVVGGLVGSVAANVATSRQKKDEGTPAFGQVGYLAVTEQEVALLRGKRGAFKPKVGEEVVGRMSRAEIQGVDYDKGALKGELKLDFGDGGAWEFEVPKVYNKTAEKVVEALKASV